MRNGLFINENIKTWRQTSTKILVIILAAIFILIPVGDVILNLLSQSGYSIEDNYDYYIEAAEKFRDAAAEDVNARLSFEHYMNEAEVLKFFIDNRLIDSWKYRLYQNEYSGVMRQLAGYRLIVEEGYAYEDIMSYGWFDYYYPGYSYHSPGGAVEYYYPDSEKEDKNINIPTAEEIRTQYESLILRAAELRETILKAEFKDYLSGEMTAVKTDYEQSLAFLEQLRTEKKANPDNDEIKVSLESAELRVEGKAEILKLYQTLIDTGATEDSWQYKTVSDMLPRAYEARANYVPMSEESFNSSYQNSYYDSYEEYRKQTEAQRVIAEDAAAILQYSLKKDIPTPQSLSSSAKKSWQDDMSGALYVVSIFMIIIAGTIMANEYSSGSIRLLLIRPKKRTKILTSKVLAILAWSYGLMFAAALIILVLDVLIYGVSDIFVPDIYYTGSHFILLPGFVTGLRNIFIISLPYLFISSIALLLSLLTKKAVLSIALPLIISWVGSVLTALTAMLRYIVPFIDYTILPYFSMSGYLAGPVENIYRSYDYGVLLGISGAGSSGSLLTGCIVLLAHTALMIFLSFLAFTKQQIKN